MLKLTEQQRKLARSLLARANPWLKAAGSLINNGGFELSGHLAFMAFLAVFPFLIFLAALFGMLGDEQTAQTLVGFLFRFAPGDVAETLAAPIYQVMHAHRGDLVTVGILGTLWAASSWFEAVRTALNSAYRVEEPRSIWWRRLQSLLFVLASAFVLLIASAAIVLGPLAWQLIQRLVTVGSGIGVVWDVGRYLVGGVLFGGFLLVLHRFLPKCDHTWRNLLPGVVFTLFAWLGVSTVLSIYLATVGNYESTYGALGGVVITLLFFYSASLSFIYGAELNAALGAKPGAKMADAPEAAEAPPA